MNTHLLVTLVAAAACSKDAAKSQPTKADQPSAAVDRATRLDITVTDKGFEPEEVKVPAGKPVTLVFTRKTEQTCIKDVVLTMADGNKVQKQLPLDTAVEIAATFPTAGKLTYACGMDMMKGQIAVQ